jgi:hypothetical protein
MAQPAAPLQGKGEAGSESRLQFLAVTSLKQEIKLMKNRKIDAVEVWKQMEDLAVPQLRLSPYERAVYPHLLRHSRLEGKAQIRFGILRLSEAASLSDWAVRKAVRGQAPKARCAWPAQ